MIEKIEKALANLRQNKPVVLNLTNFVTMDFVANSLLATGAAPIMSVCEDEIEELVTICSAIYINIGTLNTAFVDLTNKAIEFSKKYGKPIILDPVGAGATKIRTRVAKDIAPHASIIRGNASEIMALADKAHATKGVESVHATSDAKEVASRIALTYQATIVVSGSTDLITDGSRTTQVAHGSALMSTVTGMGCTVTAILAAFRAAVDDPFEASLLGVTYFALCGEIAAGNCNHPGNFKSNFIDQLHAADFKTMKTLL